MVMASSSHLVHVSDLGVLNSDASVIVLADCGLYWSVRDFVLLFGSIIKETKYYYYYYYYYCCCCYAS